MIKIQDVAYVRFGAPDLDVSERFLTDFGMRTASRTEDRLYMRGFGTQPFVHVSERNAEPKALGFGLLAQSRADLERVAAAHGVAVTDNPEPGGGSRVQLLDPQGLRIDVVHGFAPAAPLPRREALKLNTFPEHRRLGGTQRPEPGPSHVMRLGHVVVRVPDFELAVKFYSENFGFKVSDGFFDGKPENRIVAFLRCGLGAAYTDHHTIALIANGAGFEHCAFEVLDWDDIVIGHQFLKSHGYKHSWGVGRHVEGSQVFDYWRDPFGHKIEHWTDGDQVNDSYSGRFSQITPESLAQWGPDVTKTDFLS